jgi:hypothetical protein
MPDYIVEILEDNSVLEVTSNPVVEVIVATQGVPGRTGDTGESIQYQWNGTSLGVKLESEAEYQYVDLKGATGDKGDSIEFVWNSTQLGVRIQGQTEYTYVDLKGATGEKGDKPSHQWIGTSLQIQNPDGTWGAAVDLKGASGEGTGDMLVSVYDTDGDGKVNSAVSADAVPWTGINGKPSTFPPDVHNHDLSYEPKNANIQAHVTSPHAPSNAQKNSDITKAEIEAKLTGVITTHSHALPAHTHTDGVVNVDASKTLALTDVDTIQTCTNATDIDITIPLNSAVAFPVGAELAVVQLGAGGVRIVATPGVTLYSDGSKTAIKGQNLSVALKKIATDTWVLVGALKA